MSRAHYIGPFVPPEWIAAHGLEPCHLQLSATHTGRGIRPGLCPFAEALMNHLPLPDNAPLVVAITCDQMRRAAEWLALDTAGSRSPVFGFHVPATCHAAAREQYRLELERLSRFLVQYGGTKPSADQSLRAMRRFNGPSRRSRSVQHDGIPVAVIGGPLLREHAGLLMVIERYGGRIALDATEESERTHPNFDGIADQCDTTETLTRAYFDTIPDVFRRPDGAIDHWLEKRLKGEAIAGIVLYSYLWCDLWRCKLLQLAADLSLPALHLEIGPESRLNPRTITRVEAFMETLR